MAGASESIGKNSIEIRELKTYFIAIQDDMSEIKVLLRRTAPYERKN